MGRGGRGWGWGDPMGMARNGTNVLYRIALSMTSKAAGAGHQRAVQAGLSMRGCAQQQQCAAAATHGNRHNHLSTV